MRYGTCPVLIVFVPCPMWTILFDHLDPSKNSRSEGNRESFSIFVFLFICFDANECRWNKMLENSFIQCAEAPKCLAFFLFNNRLLNCHRTVYRFESSVDMVSTKFDCIWNWACHSQCSVVYLIHLSLFFAEICSNTL